jgi:ureidoglycolate hydrolase
VAKVAGISKMATGHLTVYKSSDMKAEFFERHLKHEETFNVLGDGAFVTIAGLPTETDKPDLDKLWAFVVKGGEILRVPADYWHCVPYSLEKEKTVVAITYNPDQVTEFWHIPDSDRIAIG